MLEIWQNSHIGYLEVPERLHWFFGRHRLEILSLFFPSLCGLEIRTKNKVTFFLIPLIGGNGVWAIRVDLGGCLNWRKKGIGLRKCWWWGEDESAEGRNGTKKAEKSHDTFLVKEGVCSPQRQGGPEYVIFPGQSQGCKRMWDPSMESDNTEVALGSQFLWPIKANVVYGGWRNQFGFVSAFTARVSSIGSLNDECLIFPKDFNRFHTNTNSFVQGGPWNQRKVWSQDVLKVLGSHQKLVG